MLAVAMLAAAAVQQAAALQMTIPPTGKECLLEEVSAGNKLTGSFEVMHGGMLDVDATVS